MIPRLYEENERQLTSAVVGSAIAGMTVAGEERENLTPFTVRVLARLSDAISCDVIQSLDGMNEIEMKYPNNGIYYSLLTVRRIIYVGEPYRIYKIKRSSRGTSIVYARHISYDLSGYDLPEDITVNKRGDAINGLGAYTFPFHLTDYSAVSSKPWTTVGKPPASIRSWMLNKEGSIVDTYGGSWTFHGFDCNYYSYGSTMTDNLSSVREGKNIVKLEYEENSENMYTAVKPYYYMGDVRIIGDLVKTSSNISNQKVLMLDATNYFGENTPTIAQLTSYAKDYISKNHIGKRKINLKIDYVAVNNIKGSIGVGVKLMVYYPQFKIEKLATISNTEYDVLKERYTKIEFQNTDYWED